MSEDPIARRLKDAIRRKSETPGRDRFEALVQGAIDGEGRVLIRSPYPSDRGGTTDEILAGTAPSKESKAAKALKGTQDRKNSKS